MVRVRVRTWDWLVFQYAYPEVCLGDVPEGIGQGSACYCTLALPLPTAPVISCFIWATSQTSYWTAELRVQRTCSVEQSACHQPCVKTCHWLHSRQNWKRIFSGVHNDSRRPPGAVAVFSRCRRHDISDFTYLLTYLYVSLPFFLPSSLIRLWKIPGSAHEIELKT